MKGWRSGATATRSSARAARRRRRAAARTRAGFTAASTSRDHRRALRGAGLLRPLQRGRREWCLGGQYRRRDCAASGQSLREEREPPGGLHLQRISADAGPGDGGAGKEAGWPDAPVGRVLRDARRLRRQVQHPALSGASTTAIYVGTSNAKYLLSQWTWCVYCSYTRIRRSATPARATTEPARPRAPRGGGSSCTDLRRDGSARARRRPATSDRKEAGPGRLVEHEEGDGRLDRGSTLEWIAALEHRTG